MTDERRLKHKVSIAEHLRIFDEEIAPDLFSGASTAELPSAVIYGGQPGAGKSMSINATIAEFGNERPVAIIGDDLRAYHPRYEQLLSLNDDTAAYYTDADTAGWVEMAIDHAKHNRFSMVIEGTMRNPDKVAATMSSLRDAGYLIDARIIVVKHAYSWQGVVERFETQKADKGYGRMTKAEAHDAAYNGMLATVSRIESEKLADHITLFRREGPFYRRRLEIGEWSTKRTAEMAIKQERRRIETPDEIRELINGYARIEKLLARPERGASVSDIETVRVLAEAARLKLARAQNPPVPKRKGRKTADRKKKGGKDPYE